MRLHPALGPLAGETPASVTSRNAMRHRAPTARLFCLDLGLSLQDIVDGERVALDNLSGLLGVPVADLSRDAITRSGTGYAYRGQELVPHVLRRSTIMVCPRCLSADLAADGEPWRAAGRAVWQLAPILTCARHGIALVQAGRVDRSRERPDFVRNVMGILPSVGRLADDARDVAPTALERYLLDRIEGASGEAWLDALPWHAAARVCQMIGAVAVDGPRAPIRTYGGPEWHRAGDVGYELAARGVEGIRGFLDRLRTTYPIRHVDNGGPGAWWGRLHAWLLDTVSEPAYDPLRDVVLGYMADNVPVGPTDEYYGRTVVKVRRFHTINSASVGSGLHPRRLRKILAKEGYLPVGHADLPNNSVIFAADGVDALLERIRHAVSHDEAAKRLNMTVGHLSRLVHAGLIAPCAVSKEDNLRSRTYAVADLDAFLATVLDGAVAMDDPGPNFVGINVAANRNTCTAAEVLRLIIDRRLGRVGRKVGERGFPSILVDHVEVQGLIQGDYGSDMKLRDVEMALSTSTAVVASLVRTGTLPSRIAISPLNRHPYRAVKRADFEVFALRYATLYTLARERNVHFRLLKKRLLALGIEPAFDPAIMSAAFYVRKSVPI